VDKPKISMIVPVYNSEKYLSRCIESILNQTYKNIELILINDGSNDRSGEICDQYARNCNHIVVVHKKNSGVSDARNEGIKLSSGEYLQFVDSDDYIDGNMTEMLVKALQQESSDLIICGYKIINDTTGQCMLMRYLYKQISLSFEEMMNIYDDLYLNFHVNPLWNKIYKAKVIKENHIIFDSTIDLGEDLIFNIEVIKRCNRFLLISSCPYNYIQYKGDSLSTKYRSNMYEIQKLLFQKIIALYTDRFNYSKQINNLERQYSRTIMINVVLHSASCSDLRDFKTYIEKMKIIRRDEVLRKSINSLELHSKQEKIIKLLFQRNMYSYILIYAKARLFLKNRLPLAFSLLTRWGGSNCS